MAIIVPREGVPAGPWKISKLEVNEAEVVPAGGMKVNEANRNWTRVRTMGGSCRRKMRMAMVSYIGQDLRMVDARANGLMELDEGFFVEEALSARRGFCCSSELPAETSPFGDVELAGGP